MLIKVFFNAILLPLSIKEAKGLLAESARLLSEAATMDPVVKKATKVKKAKVSA